ncbi:MAG: hypothetical protein NT013_19520 [Planctomycetia bacterium]|nr:hypothetical protein [Planctomycetia bacterium]
MMRQPGSIVLISCYELGHQPLGLASPLGFLERTGFAPAALDIARCEFDERLVGGAEFVGISVLMHTALRLGVRVAQRVRDINPRCHVCFYGLYATLNADYLLDNDADSIVGGEYEAALASLIEAVRQLTSTGFAIFANLGGTNVVGRTIGGTRSLISGDL